MIATPDLDRLMRERPEWQPWLTVVEEALRETGDARWDAAVPPCPASDGDAPLLARARVTLDAGAVEHLLRRLLRAASRCGAPALARMDSVMTAGVDLAALFDASVRQAPDRIDATAAECAVDGEGLQAVAALLPLPFLHACRRRWEPAVPEGWMKGCCPVCGSWPAFAEVRGIERSRYLRCARCGAGWRAHALTCPFCATADHERLVSLVPGAGTNAVIEACTQCSGFVKAFTTLQGCPPEAVMLADLASVDLDLAAVAQGYTRPSGAGFPLETSATLVASRRLLPWRWRR